MNNPKQGAKFDKVLRENMEANLPGIIEHVLGMSIVNIEEIPDDLQKTKERKPDLLKKVRDGTGKVFILHIEYQKKHDKDMVYRMAEYSILLQWKYHLPVKQFVIYIGIGKSSMVTRIKAENFWFRYHSTSLSAIDHRIFLKSDVMEQKLLAVLGNPSEQDPTQILKEVLNRIYELDIGDLSKDRYINQLRVLVQLRNLEQPLEEIMLKLSDFFKVERDPYYRIGERNGVEKGIKLAMKDKAEVLENQATAIARILKLKGLSTLLISEATELSIDEIKKL
ncbi:RpnC/YadD family protein [Pedobacter caeni]|nr:hypothetical protein [Pedobacter caeni]